jgi:hypothetical protein
MEALTRPNWNPARRCTATARSGEQCRRQPIPGGEVCVLHGGAAPQVQKSAKVRAVLLGMARQSAVCECSCREFQPNTDLDARRSSSRP